MKRNPKVGVEQPVGSQASKAAPVRDEPPPKIYPPDLPENPPDPDPLNDLWGEQRDYQPELAADWWPAGFGNCDPITGAYSITLRGPVKDAPVVVATIMVSDVFSKENQRRIAWFLSHAPELWRMLRTVTVDYLQHDQAWSDDFHKARTLLWRAAQRQPFEVSEEMTDDEDIYLKNIERISRELKATKAKGGAK